MARYISEESLKQKLESLLSYQEDYELLEELIAECRELNPWMTLEEFLKSGFEGWCWIINDKKYAQMAYFYEDTFYWNDQDFDDLQYQIEAITHVKPIHKPEPTR